MLIIYQYSNISQILRNFTTQETFIRPHYATSFTTYSCSSYAQYRHGG